MKMFNTIIMASDEHANLLKDCYFYDGANAAAVDDGAVVSVKEALAHDLYTTMKDLNARKATAYDSTYPIWGVVDYVGVSEGSIQGVTYRVGSKLAGLGVPAGENTRVRIPEVGDEFYLMGGNFTAGASAVAPAAGKYAAPANGLTTWTVANAAPANGPYIYIEDTRVPSIGQVNGDTMYRCRVLKV